MAIVDDDRASSGTLEIAVFPRVHGWMVEVQDREGARRVPLSKGTLVLGSGRDAELLVRDPTVSARHCELAVLGSGVSVRDLGSKNGTFVGGARVEEAWGGAGTTLTIGQSSVMFSSVDGCEEEDLGEPLAGIAGASSEMRRVASQVRRLANHSAPVLIAGETGTGKELVARALHAEGQRKSGPFIAINVAALPRELVESEMFGHERGAFTGAVTRRAGAFHEAEDGTLFLDEIGELPIDAQPKLLRALDGYEVRRVGSSGGGRRAGARVVAATHAPLEDRVTRGLFRRDLFHRLEVFVIELPPLRARPGDIAPIARMLTAQMEQEIGKRELTPGGIARLAAHDWPGNVRELRNVLYRAADLAGPNAGLCDQIIERAMRRRDSSPPVTFTPALAKTWLAQHDNNLSAAARAAGMPRTSFRKLLGEKK